MTRIRAADIVLKPGDIRIDSLPEMRGRKYDDDYLCPSRVRRDCDIRRKITTQGRRLRRDLERKARD